MESHSWVPAGLGTAPNLGLSQQSTSACINMSCRSRGTSLCTSILLTCDFMIRKENWDVLSSPHVFSHLKRVCIIWSLRMGFCLEENCAYVCMCLCVWEVCRFLMFGFSSFTKSCSESSTPMNGKAFYSQCNTVITYLSPFLSVERWIWMRPIFYCSSGEASLLTPVEATGWLQWEGGNLDMGEGVFTSRDHWLMLFLSHGSLCEVNLLDLRCVVMCTYSWTW